MKKWLITVLSALLILSCACPVFADDDLDLIATGELAEEETDVSGEDGDLIQYSDGSVDAADYVFAEPAEKDPGEYLTAPNGYAYTAPKVPDNTLKIYDFADLLTDAEEASLKNDIARAEKSRDCTVLVLTTRNTEIDPNYDVAVTRAYAEDFYEANRDGLNADAWILCIDMKNRVIFTVGYGRFAKEKYVGFTKEVYNDVVEYAAQGRYGDVVRTFARDVYKLDNWVNALIPTALSLAISAGLALLTMVVLLGRHKSAEPVKAANLSVKVLNKQRLGHDVVFLGKNTTTRHISRDSGGGGDGGGFSGGMHTSGGGSVTSGGGGHF